MFWTALDFQRIAEFDEALIEQLKSYLDEREKRLREEILQAIAPELGDEATATKDIFGYLDKRRRLIELGSSPAPGLEPFLEAMVPVNRALWNYVEVLEGATTELFDQLWQLGLKKWAPEIFRGVKAVQNVLNLRLEAVEEQLTKLEKQLQEIKCLSRGRSRGWRKFNLWRYLSTPLIDPALHRNVKKSLKFLSLRFQDFTKRFDAYGMLNEKIDASLEKFGSFVALKNLESNDRKVYQQLYRLLRLWELDRKTRDIAFKDIARAINHLLYHDKAIRLFRSYLNQLQEMVFESSRMFKTPKLEAYLASIGESMESFQIEAKVLRRALSNYRHFLLQSDPNPYTRSRWGFMEWVVGPEPRHTKELVKLVYETQRLEEYIERILLAATNQQEKEDPFPEIENLLHELGQPLLSRNLIRHRVETLFGILETADELCCRKMETVVKVGEVLTKVLGIDWKHQVVHEMPLFEELYEIHMGILAAHDDVTHHQRLKKFREIIVQIEEWVKSGGTYKHSEEIEVDINDIKEQMQDFLGHLQRDVKRETDANIYDRYLMAQRNLLEYRYIFGEFLYHLRTMGGEGDYIRAQFLFLDQYFEAMEAHLTDWKRMLFPEES
ncbi:MAG: hypothetical protein KDK65_03085 [Chlamydiia bacterium]|nr:hypothetical protein [Chlamydiia bacterium]